MTMQSEVDAELLLEIKMKEVVRVRSVARRGLAAGSSSIVDTPRKVSYL